MVPSILKGNIERKGGILSSSHPGFFNKAKKKNPSHHKAIHMIHKILNKMTESGDKGKNTGTVEPSGRGSRSASRSIQKYKVLSVMDLFNS